MTPLGSAATFYLENLARRAIHGAEGRPIVGDLCRRTLGGLVRRKYAKRKNGLYYITAKGRKALLQ